MKRVGAEAILTAIIIPIIIWFAGFVVSSYNSFAEVQNIKEDIRSIKEDTNYIRNYLLEKK